MPDSVYMYPESFFVCVTTRWEIEILAFQSAAIHMYLQTKFPNLANNTEVMKREKKACVVNSSRNYVLSLNCNTLFEKT